MSGLLMIIKRRLQICTGEWKKKCNSRVADESSLTEAVNLENGVEEDIMNNNRPGFRRNRSRGRTNIWLLMKAPLSALARLRGDLDWSSMDAIEERIAEENTRNARLGMWFAGDLSMAERNYLAVQNSTRYTIFV
eukprot:Gb_16037 [translate_table: standard]